MDRREKNNFSKKKSKIWGIAEEDKMSVNREKGKANKETEKKEVQSNKQSRKPRVRFTSETVDNEEMNKMKKSVTVYQAEASFEQKMKEKDEEQNSDASLSDESDID